MSRFSMVRDVLTRTSTWFAVLAAASALYAAFGSKPQATWQVIKAADQATTLPTNDVDKAPGGAVVFKGLPVDEVKQRELAEKIASAMAVMFGLLAAFTGQREDPPASPPGGSRGGSYAGTVGPIASGVFLLAATSGCANVAPGNDPVLVNAQRSRAVAWESVKGFLDFDHANREFVKANVPAAHQFAEDLRKQINPPDKSPGVFDQLNNAIDAYKASRTTADGQVVESQLERVGNLARSARLYLLQLQERPPPAPG